MTKLSPATKLRCTGSLFLSLICVVGIGCGKTREAADEKIDPPLPDATTTPYPPASDSTKSETRSTQSAALPGKKAVPTDPPTPSANTYACANNNVWRSLSFDSLKTGTLQTPVEGVVLPSPVWRPCEGQDYCEQLVLGPSQEILALGQDGNKLRMVTAERCGENTSITVGEPDLPANVALRGVDMDFQSAAVGGDRFLLGGFARHKSREAENGFVPREVLVTSREGKFAKLEAVRNKLSAVPLAAASQLVRVKLGEDTCTTTFWKLGVEQCELHTPNSNNFALFGSHLIYVDGEVGMKWNAKEGAAKLLPQLDWVFTDGVNVAWSTKGVLTITQPRYDLPELEGTAAPGKAGPRPSALGCGRMLTRQDGYWSLRNIAKGTEWRLPDSRFEKAGPGALVMDCHSIIFQNGIRILLKGLGALESIPEATTKAPPPSGQPHPSEAVPRKGEQSLPERDASPRSN